MASEWTLQRLLTELLVCAPSHASSQPSRATVHARKVLRSEAHPSGSWDESMNRQMRSNERGKGSIICYSRKWQRVYKRTHSWKPAHSHESAGISPESFPFPHQTHPLLNEAEGQTLRAIMVTGSLSCQARLPPLSSAIKTRAQETSGYSGLTQVQSPW